LEENLKHLLEEVETLSSKNERLFHDLKIRDFYHQYNDTKEEVNIFMIKYIVGCIKASTYDIN
jgi:hypothetical protein